LRGGGGAASCFFAWLNERLGIIAKMNVIETVVSVLRAGLLDFMVSSIAKFF
jgi:hypothetical protein